MIQLGQKYYTSSQNSEHYRMAEGMGIKIMVTRSPSMARPPY
jgi:hypothetical protein